jgi:zinc/manganese transport system permease protein
MTLYDFLIAPFADYAFMRRALVACLALGLSCGAFGTFLLLRRMSLMGDALSHAILPGAAIGFLLAGLSLWAMSLGGLVAGIVVAMAAGLISRRTEQREDASLASLYLISLAAGVVLISLRGSALDLMHLLFGNVLAVDDAALLLVAGVSSLSLIILAIIYRPLVAECLDPTFLRALGVAGGLYHLIFLLLIVLNLVAGFQALGTLMAVGLLISCFVLVG